MSAVAQPEFLPTRLSLLSRLRNLEDQNSWQRFYDTYWQLIFNVARRTGLNEAEAQDVVQETVIAIAKQMPNFRYDRAQGTFKGWLLTITHRRITDLYRRRHYHQGGRLVAREQPLDTPLLATQPYPELALEKIWADEWEQHVLQTALTRVKKGIKPLQFQMFHLHVIKGVQVEEVARRLGVKSAEVYWAKYRLGTRLRKEIRLLRND